MRKLISFSLVAIAALSAICYRIHVSHTVQNALTILNLEALSRYEFIVGWDKGCIAGGDGCCTCPSCWYPNDHPVN